MTVAYLCPSARPPAEADPVLSAWRAKGYRLSVFRDAGAAATVSDVLLSGEYRGYAATLNLLAAEAMKDPGCDWMIAGNDDLMPDATHTPEQIADECLSHFGNTFAVMQCTGDRYGAILTAQAITHPWMGREWVRRINGGRGPLWPGFYHFFEDACHRDVALKYGRLWERPDLCQYHDHWQRKNMERPGHLTKAAAAWQASHDLYESLRAAGYPGSEPIP
jgi:hypothetical protein